MFIPDTSLTYAQPLQKILLNPLCIFKNMAVLLFCPDPCTVCPELAYSKRGHIYVFNKNYSILEQTHTEFSGNVTFDFFSFQLFECMPLIWDHIFSTWIKHPQKIYFQYLSNQNHIKYIYINLGLKLI